MTLCVLCLTANCNTSVAETFSTYTHKKIFGCNNLVSYKVENTMDLQGFLPCCNLVNATLTVG